jgi:hypothetical protein
VLKANARERIISRSNWELLPGFFPGFSLPVTAPTTVYRCTHIVWGGEAKPPVLIHEPTALLCVRLGFAFALGASFCGLGDSPVSPAD